MEKHTKKQIVIEILPRALWVVMAICLYPGQHFTNRASLMIEESLLWELRRVLKSDGVLFATPEHLEIDEFMDIMGKGGLFSLVGEREGLFEFERVKGG